jgi:uroporphyrinogen-III synthase
MSTSLRVVLAGAADVLPSLDAMLDAEGVTCCRVPVLRFAEPSSWQPVDEAIGSWSRFGAIAITSPRGANALLDRVARADVAMATAPGIWTGEASAERLRAVFPRVHTPAPSGRDGPTLGVALAETMLRAGVSSPVLFLCGDVHRNEMVIRLLAAGRRVEHVVAYRSLLVPIDDLQPALVNADVVVGTSPRVMQQLIQCFPEAPRPLLIAIGRTSANSASAAGWPADQIAEQSTAEAVLQALHALTSSVS